MEQIKKDESYAPNPYTERAYSSNMSVSKDGKWLGYSVGNVIVLRSLDDFKTCKIYTAHKVKTSAVGFSPNGYFAASGDCEGNIKIWFLDDMSLKKEFPNALGGKITGIEWNDESNKLFFYGQGKTAFARCITWDSGNNIGEISAHSKVILTGDMKKNRPYRIATGSEDFQVNFYEGTPFKFNKMNKEHGNFVTGVRYSPNNEFFVSVGFDKKIVLYDGKVGTVLGLIAEDKSVGNHTMAIIGVCWLDDNTIATCSLDKTVKVWDVVEKVLKYTLYPKDKTLLDIPESGCAIVSNGIHIISLSLSGILNVWKISEFSDEKLPDIIIDGHQNYVCKIIKTQNDQIISADYNGKIIVWNADKVGTTINHNNNRKVISLSLSKDEKILYSLDNDGNVSLYDLNEIKQMYYFILN